MSKKLVFIGLALLAVILFSYFNGLALVYAEEAPELPGYTSFVEENPAANIGPGAPAVVFPGENFTVVLKSSYATTGITSGYIYRVVLEDDELHLYNYTVTVTCVDNTTYNVTIPSDVKPGLYDLVLTGKVTYRVERSVWVITGLNDVLRIAHISDLHFGTGYPDVFAGDRKRVAGLILVNLLKPDIVINTGDEADTAASSQYIAARAFRYMFLYDYPVFLNPGNHDWPNSEFIRYYGPTTWYRLIGDKILLIAINTDGERGYPDWPQIKAVQELLEKYRNIPIKIIQMHHPVFYWQGELNLYYNASIFYVNPRENPNSPLSYYWGANLSMVRYFLKLCEDYNVSIVFAGHIHRDQYVLYHSIRTNTTTYFITTTTFAHSTGTYNGFQYIVLNLTNLNMTFPYAPPSFIGFKNYSKDSVWNSIFNLAPYWSCKYWFTKHAYTFDLMNGVLNVSNTIVLALPWRGEYKGVYVEGSNGAYAVVKDYLLVDNFLFIAIKIDMPRDSELTIVVYNMEDNKLPHIEYKMSIPSTPTLGRTNKLYFDIEDDEWGIRDVEAAIIYSNQEFPVNIRMVNPTTYVVELTGYTGTEPKTITLKITVMDYANNTITVWYEVTLYPMGMSPTQTPIRTLSVSPTTTTTTTINTTTPSSTTPANTTSPMNTTTSPSTTSPTTTTPTTTSTPTTSKKTTQVEEADYTGVYVAVIILLIVVIIAVVIMRKK